METISLELIFTAACDYYDELEIQTKKPNIITYSVYANDLVDEKNFFEERGIPISLCIDRDFEMCYLECYDIRQQVSFDGFKKLKKQFVNRYFEVSNNDKKHNVSKLENLYQKMKEKRDKQRVAILSEIIDVDVENVENAHELIQRMISQTFNDRIVIR